MTTRLIACSGLCVDVGLMTVECGEYTTILVPPHYPVNTEVFFRFIVEFQGQSRIYESSKFIVSTKACKDYGYLE